MDSGSGNLSGFDLLAGCRSLPLFQHYSPGEFSSGKEVLQLAIYVHPTWSPQAGLLGLFLSVASLNFSSSNFLPSFLFCSCIYGFSLAQQLVASQGEGERRVKTQMIY